jgi:hypothetical protein
MVSQLPRSGLELGFRGLIARDPGLAARDLRNPELLEAQISKESASTDLLPLNWRVVPVRPRNPLNIGAAARAMANFGFRDLVVVNPYEPPMGVHIGDLRQWCA